jgi:hypothetical protein
MRWQDLESDTEAGLWKGLELRVETEPTAAARPGLHMQAGSPRLMRLMAGEWPLVWARVESDHYGYWYLRRPVAGNSPGLVLPPISALEARSVEAPTGSPEWFRSWSRTFGRKLVNSPVSPLYGGRWWLMPGEVRERDAGWLPTGVAGRSLASVCHLDRVAVQPPAGYAAWDFGDALDPLAMRPMSGPDDARVNAWRRALREGYMPPALLMWMSGLDRYIILDGHDRIAAALAESTMPSVLVLCHVQEQPRPPDAFKSKAVAEEVARQLTASRSPDLRPNSPFRIETANRMLIDAFDDRPHLAPVSRAWRLDGGASRWRSQVSHALSGLNHDDVRRGLLQWD